VTGQLILILGDQLSQSVSSLRSADKVRDIVLMCEVCDEATYVRHHKKKIALIFSAMRHFSEELRSAGWSVDYRTLTDTGPNVSFSSEVARAVAQHKPARIVVTSPGEWRVLDDMRGWQARFAVPVDILDDNRFICSRAEFAAWAQGRKQLRMEYFYREMRRKTGLLMDGAQPAGGQCNFDHDNRKPAKPDLLMPRPRSFVPDAVTRGVLQLVASRFSDHFGDLEPFWFAVTRADAEQALDHFIATALAQFGDFQDAMLEGEAFLYHSVLSIYMNIGLLDPLDVCRRVDAAYRTGRVPLNAAEGYIRQIIGWREYVRGIYWLKMPGYVDHNFFGHDRPVPDFYWTGETDMACLRSAIGQTQREAYAHHIQRLMATGNFALLAGVSPQALHEWYLTVYADAFEWVELPNTLGMSQFGDGGLLASKPYVASGAYITRMSNHCKGCRYDVGKPHGPDACPFNALYWNFLARHRDKLAGNPRMAQMYRTWDKLSPERRRDTLKSAESFLASLDALHSPVAKPRAAHAAITDQQSGRHDRIAEMILSLCGERGAAKSVCPSDVARALAESDDTWCALMPEIRRVAGRLAAQGRIVVTQRGTVVDAESARGAIRLSVVANPKIRRRR
jgi:deoxyribodipyrimidine photolyase-related protein